MTALARFARIVLGVNLAVVVWGAFVRASGSGAGCGKHWPLCNGEVLPRAPAVETAIEFTHRATSGVSLALVVALAVWAARSLPRGAPGRKAAWTALAFMITEALVGAALVLFGWVAKDASASRGWVMAVHLTNTFLLLGALALVADWTARPGGLSLAGRARPAAALGIALGAVLLTGVTGAIAALGDTLFPSTSFAEGLRADLSGEAHLLLRLRVFHPFAAIAAGALALGAARLALRAAPGERVRRAALALALLVALQLAAGAANVLLLAPVALQLAHLLLADLLWIALVLVASAALEPSAAPARAEAPPAAGVRAPG
jgi:cytochrome c oxidase assembly protein subunit 15